MSDSNAAESNVVGRFALEGEEIRGQYVRLDSTWWALREHLDYPPVVRDLLGEAVAAAVLLASTLKFDGSLTLQMQGSGAVRLLVAQCTQDFQVRAMALFDAARVTNNFSVLAGEGQIVVTVETQRTGASYQGIVPLTGDSLSACLDGYFMQSEQLPTQLRLVADAKSIGGLLIQRIPGAGGTATAGVAAGGGSVDASAAAAVAAGVAAGEAAGAAAALVDTQRGGAAEANWARAQATLRTISAEDLLLRPVADLARSCFAEQDLRLFAARAVVFQCRCSAERVGGVLRSLGIDDVRALVREQGKVVVTCEFCQKPWNYDAIDVEQLFVQPLSEASDAVN